MKSSVRRSERLRDMKGKQNSHGRRGVASRALPMRRRNDERKYWKAIWRKARRMAINLPDKKWCDYWHTHFDFESSGMRSRCEHRRHIRPLMRAFARVQCELASQSMPYQVYACIFPSDSGSDALYVHTPNPQTEFPVAFDESRFAGKVPPLLMGLVNLDSYNICISESKGCAWYTVIPRIAS